MIELMIGIIIGMIVGGTVVGILCQDKAEEVNVWQ